MASGRLRLCNKIRELVDFAKWDDLALLVAVNGSLVIRLPNNYRYAQPWEIQTE